MEKLKAFILEGILCHLGEHKPTSLEAKIVACADGTDMTKGRARIPDRILKSDIHKFSALAIEKVIIRRGEKKPVRIEIHISDAAGVFQIEQQLLQKIMDVGFQEYVEIAGMLGKEELKYLF